MNTTEPNPVDEEFAAEMRERRQQTLAGDQSPMALARNRVILVVVILLLPAIIVGSYYLLVPPEKSTTTNERVSTPSTDPSKGVGSLNTADQKLQALSRLERAANPQLALPVQTRQFEDRIEICEQLVAMENDKKAQNAGILGKLAVLTQWQHLNAMNQIDDGSNVGGLLEWAKTLLAHNSDEVAKRAHTTVALADVIAFARQSNQEDFSTVVDHFSAATKKARDSRVNAQALFRAAKWLQSQEHPNEAGQLFQVLESNFADSGDREIKAIATLASTSFHRIAFDFVGLSKQINANAPNSEVLAGFSMILDDPRIGAPGYLGLVAVVDLCMSKSQWTLAESMQQRLQTAVPTLPVIERDKISDSIQEQALRLKARNRVFSFHNLQPLTQPKDQTKNLDNRNRFGVVMYWDPGHNEAVQQINVMMLSADGLSKLDADLIVICDQQLESQEKTLLRSAADQAGEINFIVADENDDAGAKLKSQFPVSRYPFVLLLGRGNEILMINPSGPDLRKELERLN